MSPSPGLTRSGYPGKRYPRNLSYANGVVSRLCERAFAIFISTLAAGSFDFECYMVESPAAPCAAGKNRFTTVVVGLIRYISGEFPACEPCFDSISSSG